VLVLIQPVQPVQPVQSRLIPSLRAGPQEKFT
jgi:hypothetical protein